MTGAEEAYFAPGADKGHPDASGLRREEFPSGIAPAHVVTAGYDPLRDEGEALARLLSDSGVQVDAKRYPSMIHGFLHFVGPGHEGPAYNREIAGRLRAALT
jgi:acetyl esterase